MELAVNIIFLLPIHITKNAIDISTQHQINSEQKILLGHEKNVAHISLWIGIISDSKIEELHQKITNLMQQKKLPEIVITNIDYAKKTSNPVFSFQVEKNESLSQWHHSISKIAEKYTVKCPANENHFNEKKNHNSSLNYLDKYYSQKNYQPHITLGFGTHKEDITMNSFLPNGIAIYHLGNHCSCHRLIKKITPDY